MTSELPKSRNPKNASLNEKTNLFFFCPCLLIGSRKRVSYFSAPIHLYIWTALPISIYYFCQMTSKLHFSHKHLENQSKKYFSICLANRVYVTYLLRLGNLIRILVARFNQTGVIIWTIIHSKSKSNKTNHNPYFQNHPQLNRKEFHYFLTPEKKIQCITSIKYKSNVSAWNSS